ncbi:MAG: hypothetical protein Q4F29_08000 [Lachnospiraceae bacterium]|nr:hypothetical protein [Lachnospiraceae bacterium]
MKKESRYAAFTLACLLAASAPLQAWAAPTDSPEFARSAEEWARLEDNKLEYEEIADLIHEYNVTVLNNRTSYRDYLGKDKSDITNRYRDAADELRNGIEYPDDPTDPSYATMMMAAQMNETQAQALEKQADNNVDDPQSIHLQYEMVEANLVLSTKLNLISYQQRLLTDALNLENKKILESQYQSAQVKAGVGAATQMDVLNARQAVEQLESTIISDAKETQTLKQKVCLAAGWSYDANPEFGALPVCDPALIDGIQLETDIAAAAENNYTLRINQRKYENSTDTATKETLEKTIQENRQKIASDMRLKYQTLLEARASYELAVAEQTVENQTLAATTLKYQTGAASRMEYEQGVYSLAAKNTAAENAKLSLLSAWENYQAAVAGLASAS